jgi:hypothetical protein
MRAINFFVNLSPDVGRNYIWLLCVCVCLHVCIDNCYVILMSLANKRHMKSAPDYANLSFIYNLHLDFCSSPFNP